MKKPLLNRLLILLSVVVSAAAVLGIVHLAKKRHVAPVAILSKGASPVPDAGSKIRTAEPTPQTQPGSAQNTETKKSQAPSVSPPVATRKAAEKLDPDKKTEETGGREMEPINDEAEAGARESWFYSQRSYPLTTIPLGARSRAVEHMELEQKRLRPILKPLPNGQSVPQSLPPWQSIGPRPIAQGQTFGNPRVSVSGRVTAIALDPGYNGNSNQTLYVGGAQGGVWKTTDNGANWTPIMDDQPTLAIGAIAIDPTNSNVIYVGTGEPNFSGDSYYGQGILKTTNGGASWTQIKGPNSPIDPTIQAFMNVVIPKIVIDPTNPSTVYTVTNANGHTGGASGGGGPPGNSGTPTIDQRGIWKSTDGGANWINLDPTNNSGGNSGTDFLIDPAKPSKLFAAIQSVGVFRFDGTAQNPVWTKLTAPPLPPTGFLRVILATGPPISPSTETTIFSIYAATDGKSILGVFRSTDGGTTWTQLTNPPVSGQTDYNLALAIDPTDSNVMYYGTQSGATLWRSNDGGQNWEDISQGNGVTGGVHADTHVLVVCPTNRNILFTGDDGGIWRSDNATAAAVSLAWNTLNSTLSITQFQGVAMHPTDPNILLGGTQDNGTNLYGGQVTWTLSVGGDGGFALIDQTNPSIMYHTFFNQNNSDSKSAQIGPQLSTNGGVSWLNKGCFNNCSAQVGNFNPADRVGFYAPMALNTGFNGQNTNVVYFGTSRLYRTADRGTTWTGLGASTDGFGTELAPLVVVGTQKLGRLSAIAAFPFSNSSPSTEIVWIGTDTGLVKVTTNAGAGASATFTDVTKAPLPNRFVTDIAVDLANSQRAIITYSGFNQNTPFSPGHVFITNNQGATFTDISGNLPDVPTTSIAIDPINANTYYVGTDIGVFRTKDGGATWEALTDGMPKVAVFMLRYHAATRSLVAATHGRGMFRLDVSSEVGNPIPIVTSIQPTSAAVQSGAFALTVNGSSFVAGATVLWNGAARTTTFNSANQLTAQILAGDLSGAGTTTVTVSNPAPGGGPSTTSATFTITKANQTINFGALGNKTFGDAAFNVSATATSGLAVTFSVLSGPATISGNTVTITGAGTVTIRASQAGDSNFNAAPNVDQSFTVAKSNQTITFGTLSPRTFGNPPFTVNATASSQLAVTFSVFSGPATISGNTVTLTGAGTVTIRASQAGSANFNAAPNIDQSFAVAKSGQTITFGALANKTAGDPPFSVNATSSSGLVVSFSVASGNATINGNTVTLTGTGIVTIQADQAGDTNFNAAVPVQQSFTVAKGQASINLSNLVQIFDGNPKSVTATTTPPGLSGLTITYNGSATAPSAVGSYSVIASLNNANFQASNSLGTLNIIGFSPIDSQNANPGGQNTATVNPSGNSPGISATLNHTSGGVTANVTVGIYTGNPTERGLVNAGGGFVDVKVTSPNAGDTVVINYYYPTPVTPVNEAALQLYYFKGTVWLPVKGSGNSVPVKNTTDNLDGTVSGGKFTVTLDNTSSPKVSELTGTVFAATTAIMGDINGDNVVNVNDLVLMANILAGNLTPTAVQKDAADVLKDATNNVTVSDLITLANFLAGNTKTLPLGN